MNWGKGIAIAMASFIIFIVVLVSILVSQKVDLVSDKYYQKDMSYQTEIDALELGKELDSLIIAQKNNQLTIQFATNLKSDSIRLNLWRPNDEKLDRSYLVTGTNLFMIPLKELQKGNYEISCEYWISNKKRIQKSNIFIEN